MKVGDTLYRFDINKREYVRDGNGGMPRGGPIFAKHFDPGTITGETAQSWLVDGGWKDRKVNKKTLREAGTSGYSGYQWYTQQQMEDAIWKHDNQRKIVEYLERGATVEQLKQIAALLSDAL